MTRPLVLLTNPIEPLERLRLAEHCEVIELAAVDAASVLAGARQAQAIIVRANLPEDIFERCPGVLAAVRHGAGTDMIPVERATAAGVMVANAPGANAVTVAEYAASQMLQLSRQLARIDRTLREQDWARARLISDGGSDLAGRTLGVIGTGAIGSALGRILKKIPVQTGNAFGFIGNRIYNAYRKQCEFMLEDGALPEEVDAALEDFGFAMGPFKVADLSGLDIAWRMRKAQAGARDPRERYVGILDALCEQGRLGRKTDAGYYTYTDGNISKSTDATVRKAIEAASASRGITRKTLSPEAIQRRALLAMVNEAALLLAEGVTARASDVDVVLVQGYGFARWQGGPIFWARQQERDELQADMQELAIQSGWGFCQADLEPILNT